MTGAGRNLSFSASLYFYIHFSLFFYLRVFLTIFLSFSWRSIFSPDLYISPYSYLPLFLHISISPPLLPYSYIVLPPFPFLSSIHPHFSLSFICPFTLFFYSTPLSFWLSLSLSPSVSVSAPLFSSLLPSLLLPSVILAWWTQHDTRHPTAFSQFVLGFNNAD